ncbi:hypothetical protein HYFRA_00009342 [Hymenoscyphus fraxineus]|uniref:2EXR domain-containing protein n=1 Tax=Hymenoscyphus fraxineus TaxID=746836 RepID=A0A9N9PRP4_9HELO|nr:hypothetical protein HYFRA_00009342 [Hymenoscyphus fraxineus]
MTKPQKRRRDTDTNAHGLQVPTEQEPSPKKRKRNTIKLPKYQDDNLGPSRAMPAKTFNTGREFTGTLSAKGDGGGGARKRGVDTTKSGANVNATGAKKRGADSTITTKRGAKRTKISRTGYIEKNGSVTETIPVIQNKTSPTTTTPTHSFPLFPLLPPELRLSIWEFASLTPRLVRWGRQAPPGIYHANRESRRIALKHTSHLIKRPLYRHLDYCFYFTGTRDILYHLTPLPTAAAMQQERRRFTPLTTSGVRRLAIPLDDAFKAAHNTLTTGILGGPTVPDNLWKKIDKLFPELEELIVLLFPHPKRGDAIADFRVVDYLGVRTTGVLGVVTGQQFGMMRVVREAWEERVVVGKKVVGKLTFVKKLGGPGVHCAEVLEA